MLRCLHRASSSFILLDGLSKRRLNSLKVLHLGTSFVHLKSLKRGDSKVMKMSCKLSCFTTAHFENIFSKICILILLDGFFESSLLLFA